MGWGEQREGTGGEALLRTVGSALAAANCGGSVLKTRDYGVQRRVTSWVRPVEARDSSADGLCRAAAGGCLEQGAVYGAGVRVV